MMTRRSLFGAVVVVLAAPLKLFTKAAQADCDVSFQELPQGPSPDYDPDGRMLIMKIPYQGKIQMERYYYSGHWAGTTFWEDGSFTLWVEGDPIIEGATYRPDRTGKYHIAETHWVEEDRKKARKGRRALKRI